MNLGRSDAGCRRVWERDADSIVSMGEAADRQMSTEAAERGVEVTERARGLRRSSVEGERREGRGEGSERERRAAADGGSGQWEPIQPRRVEMSGRSFAPGTEAAPTLRTLAPAEQATALASRSSQRDRLLMKPEPCWRWTIERGHADVPVTMPNRNNKAPGDKVD